MSECKSECQIVSRVLMNLEKNINRKNIFNDQNKLCYKSVMKSLERSPKMYLDKTALYLKQNKSLGFPASEKI